MKIWGKILAAVVGIVVIGCCVFRICQVNRMYPEAAVESYQVGQPFQYGNLTLTVEDSMLIGPDRLIQEGYIASDPDLEGINPEDMRALLITLHVQNLSDRSAGLPLYIFNAESDGWSNGLDMNWAELASGGQGIDVMLEPGEEKTVVLAYQLFAVQFQRKDWNRIDQRAFSLVFSIYPVKRMVLL